MRLSLIFMATLYNCTSCSSANFAKLEYVFKKHVIFCLSLSSECLFKAKRYWWNHQFDAAALLCFPWLTEKNPRNNLRRLGTCSVKNKWNNLTFHWRFWFFTYFAFRFNPWTIKIFYQSDKKCSKLFEKYLSGKFKILCSGIILEETKRILTLNRFSLFLAYKLFY